MPAYEANALAYAKANALTPDQVWHEETQTGWSYQQTALAAGVTINSKTGNSPADFFYQNIRRYVANALWNEREEFRREAIRKAIEDGERLRLDDPTVTVTLEGDDLVRVSSLKRSASRSIL